MPGCKVRVGDLIKRRWFNNPHAGTQINFKFKNLKDYGIVVKVDYDKQVIMAYFFNQLHTGPWPLRMGYFDIINKGDK